MPAAFASEIHDHRGDANGTHVSTETALASLFLRNLGTGNDLSHMGCKSIARDDESRNLGRALTYNRVEFGYVRDGLMDVSSGIRFGENSATWSATCFVCASQTSSLKIDCPRSITSMERTDGAPQMTQGGGESTMVVAVQSGSDVPTSYGDNRFGLEPCC